MAPAGIQPVIELAPKTVRVFFRHCHTTLYLVDLLVVTRSSTRRRRRDSERGDLALRSYYTARPEPAEEARVAKKTRRKATSPAKDEAGVAVSTSDDPTANSTKPGAPRAAQPARSAPLRTRRAAVQIDEGSWLDDVPAITLGVLCAVLPCVVKVGLRDLYQLPKIFTMTYGAAWLLAIVAGLAVLGRPISFPRTPLKWPLLALAATIGIGVSVAPDQTGGVLSIFAKMDAYRWGSALVIFAIGLATLRKPRHLFYVLGGMTAGGLLVALFGIAQHHNIKALLPADAHRWVGINAPGSTFGNRNMAAQLIVSVMPAAYVVLAMGLRWWRRGLTQRALTTAAGATTLLFVLLYYLRLSVTRSAWGGAILGLLVAGTVIAIGLWRAHRERDASDEGAEAPAEQPTRRAWPLLAGLLVSGFLVLAIATSALERSGYKATLDQGLGDSKRRQSVVELFSSVGDFDKSHWDMRFMMWESTWEAIKADPLGGGAGNWRVLFPQHVVRRSGNEHFTIAKQPVRAHQDFLQFWSEFGTQGFLALLALLAISLWMGTEVVRWQQRRSVRHRDDLAWLIYGNLASIAGITAICGDALLSFPFQLPAPTFFFFVHLAFIGSSWAVLRSVAEPAVLADGAVLPPRPAPMLPGIKIGLAVAGIIAVGFVHQTNPRLLEAEWGFTRGRSLQKRRNPAGGLAEISKAVAINPDDFQNHFIEALCYNSMGKMPEAIASIERSLALYPNLLNAWVNLALFARKAGDEPKMLQAIETALALKPDETYVLDLKADYLRKRGRQAEAAALYEPWIDGLNRDWKMPNRRYLTKYAKALEAAGQWEKLGRTYEQMIRYYIKIPYGSKPSDKRRKKRNDDYLRDRLTYWSKAADSYNKAGMFKDEMRLLKLAAGYVRRSDGAMKRRYAVALARQKLWPQAWHETGVTLDVDAKQKTALLQALGEYRIAGKEKAQSAAGWPNLSEADQAELDRIIKRVQRW